MSRVVPMNDLRRAALAEGELLKDAVTRVLEGGWYVHGPEHDQFERDLATASTASYALGVGSGTDALELALTAVKTPERHVVITAANAGGYTTVAARRSGLTVRFADVLRDTHCLDPAHVQALLRDDVAAVVVTHLYGRLGAVAELTALCRDHGVALIEDCAQAAGAVLNGRGAGSFGDVGTFSFYPTKNLGAAGDGGALTTSDPVLADRLRALRQYGWSSKYQVEVDGGRNSRLDEVQASVLRARLPQLAAANGRRRDIIQSYAAAAAGTAVQVLAAPDDSHAAHLAVAVSADRDAVRRTLEANGVQTDVHYPVPDHRQPAWTEEHCGVVLPVTDDLARQVFSLPCFPLLEDAEVEHVCTVLAKL